jgi:hypothetical protein
MRLDALRDLMRMEMPDRWTDVVDEPVTPFGEALSNLIPRPALSQAYLARYNSVAEPFTDQNGNFVHDATEPFTDVNGNGRYDPTPEFQGAECLYLIVMEALAQEGDAREVFKPDSIADTDGDRMPEFIDAWGTPIRFLRWAPGFVSELQEIAQFRPTAVAAPSSPQTVEITAPGATLSADPSIYVGGTIAVLNPAGAILGNRMARITGCVVSGANVVFTCDTTGTRSVRPVGAPPWVMPTSGQTTQRPFKGSPPLTTETVVVMSADPFDPRGVYPVYPQGAMSFDPVTEPDTSTPTFALYPLIYSEGPDKLAGVTAELADTDPDFPLRYARPLIQMGPKVGLNPFFVLPDGSMMGSFLSSSTDPNFYIGCWRDNIHNHQLNMR